MIVLEFERYNWIWNAYIFTLSHFPIWNEFVSEIYVVKRQNMMYTLKDMVILNITGKSLNNHTIVKPFKPKAYNISI